MKNLIGKNLLGLIALAFFVISCKTAKPHHYINNDSSALYSTNPARPFKYGYAYNRKTCEKYFADRITCFGIKNGDVIADVGAASGWLDGIYSVLVDSVVFYVQDIDTHYLDQKQLDQVIIHYSNQRLSPQTNAFHMVIGTTNQSNLPNATFDKIIICNTLHEIPEPDTLIADLATKIKPGGKLIILDQFSSIYKKIKHPGCGIEGSLVRDVVEVFKTYGLHLTNMTDPENSSLNYLTFEKDELKAQEFSSQTKKANEYLAGLDLLNQKKTSADSNLVIEIALKLKDHLEEVHQVFPSLTNYLDNLAEEWIDEGTYTNAINTIKVRLILYPDDAKGYYYMGFALSENKKYEEAINWCSKAIDMDTTNPDYFNTRGNILLKQKSYPKAIDDYYAALALDSAEAETYFNIGYAFEQKGNYSKAIDFYSQAFDLEPTEHLYLWYRGYANASFENFEEALDDFSKAIELDPDNWTYYQNRASVKKDMGDKDGYKEDMKLAAEIKKKSR